MHNEPNIAGVTVDLSAVESDGHRWYGKVAFSRGDEHTEGTWIGFHGSDMGELVDVDGDVLLCATIDVSPEIISAITDALGDPCDAEGKRERAMERETDLAIREAMIGA